LIVFLVLVAQFESLTSALVIVPFGLAAAIFALFITGTSLNVYSQVGLVMLIGLIARTVSCSSNLPTNSEMRAPT
jgi:multidrug efflux pump subunit AcrB